MTFRRPAIGSNVLTALVAAYVLLLCNFTFWGKLAEQFAGHPVKLVLFGVILFLLYAVFLMIFSARYVIKPVFIAVVMIAASVAYFTDTFGTIMDRDMIQNAAQTTGAESSNLITAEFLLHMLAFGIVPGLLIAWVQVVHPPFWQQVRRNTLFGFGMVALAGAILLVNLRTYVPFWQRQREITMAYLNPAMALVATVDYGIHEMRDANLVARPYGEDARIGPRLAAAKKKMLTVLVVGETARAQNFSLNGYERETNPELSARNVVAFTNVTSCGTATAISLPCMFSHLGRDGYSKRAALSSENLVDVLQHAGLTVEWWENNTGPKSVADRIPTTLLNSKDAQYDPALCDGGECLDQVLVDKLRARLDSLQGNAVLVLHTMGSHGPAYYERYPEAFEHFKPSCREAELNDCTPQELVNVYDNTILYTDHILAAIIDVLKEREGEFASAMYYMSDHGESLGENGLYLHGAPYFLAPETQKRVPFITWFSDDFASTTGLDVSCLRGKTGDGFSHDNMFDTILGMMDVQTSVYNPKLDAFASCRNGVISRGDAGQNGAVAVK